MRTEDSPADLVVIGCETAGRPAGTAVDAGAAPARHRCTRRRRRIARVARAGVAAVLFLAGCDLTGDRDTAEPAPTSPPASTVSPPTATGPIDTTDWATYTSDQYRF